MKKVPTLLFTIIVLAIIIMILIPIHRAYAATMTITANPSTWTNKSVTLTVSGSGYDKILLPNGTILANGTTATVTTSENKVYSFIGVKNDEVVVIESYVVNNIDKTGKSVVVTPNDGNWRNKDVQVNVNVK